MSDEMFWNRNGTMQQMSDVVSAIRGSGRGDTKSRFGNILSLFKYLF